MGGCSSIKKDVPPVPDLNFSGNIKVTYNKNTVECKIENKLGVHCIITVVKPELISGLTMTVKDGNCTLSMGEVFYDFDSEKLQQTEFATYISKALSDVLNTTTYEKMENGYWKYTGKTENGKFILLQDSQTGYPVSLRIPDMDLYVKFEDMKAVESQ
ncbi:MAG: hypothetical protein IJ279_04715 [Clostridia bacterium]|nr:hypothetical protein [Clostridia bacterium]